MVAQITGTKSETQTQKVGSDSLLKHEADGGGRWCRAVGDWGGLWHEKTLNQGMWRGRQTAGSRCQAGKQNPPEIWSAGIKWISVGKAYQRNHHTEAWALPPPLGLTEQPAQEWRVRLGLDTAEAWQWRRNCICDENAPPGFNTSVSVISCN